MVEKQKYKKSMMYYVWSFVAASVAVVGYGIYRSLRYGIDFWAWLLEDYLIYPFLIVGFLWIYHNLAGRARAKVVAQSREEKFLLRVSKAVKDALELEAEDVERFRQNEKFQEALFIAYQIAVYGESTEYTYEFLESRFTPGTMEYKAVKIIADEVRDMRQSDEK